MNIAILLLVSAMPGFAQGSSAPITTGGITNGRFWKLLDNNAKYAWLRGYHDGLMTAFLVASTDPIPDGTKLSKQLGAMFPAGLSFDETRAAVDLVYAVPENSPIDLSFALDYVVLKTSGISQPKLDEFLDKARRVAIIQSPEEQKKIQRN